MTQTGERRTMRPGTGNRSWLGVRRGAAISALLHIGIIAAVLLVLPETKKPKATPAKVPVEIVRPLEKKAEKKKPPKRQAKKKKPPKKKPSTATKVKPRPVPKAPPKKAAPKLPEKPEPPKKQKPLLAQKAKPKPAPEKPKPPPNPPEVKKAAPKKPEPKNSEPVKRPKPPEAKLAQKKSAKKLAKKPAKPKPKGGGRKVKLKPDNNPQISMIQRNLVGRWILQPLKVNLKHRCGLASITGVINLTRKRGNRAFGSLRTTIRWARCPAERWKYQIVLSNRGGRVVLRDSGGGVSRGLIKGNVMLLKDPYGRSVWRRSR